MYMYFVTLKMQKKKKKEKKAAKMIVVSIENTVLDLFLDVCLIYGVCLCVI